jgi:putative glutamine amidotransferase
MKPIIGIVARVEYPGETHKLVFEEEYRKAIIKSGAIPLGILPPQIIDYTTEKTSEQKELTEEEKAMLISQMKLCDGILMPGGFKTNLFDMFILEYAIENDIPMLGICLGMQIMSNYKRKELKNERNNSFIEHMVEEGYGHKVTIDKKSKLYQIVKNDSFLVTSRHNYHIYPNEEYVVSSVSDDNYIESIEMPNKKFNLGVQWHPEGLTDEYSKKLFEYFIYCCRCK